MFRRVFARQLNRELNLRDIFQRFLISSDPVISSLRKVDKKKKNVSNDIDQFLEHEMLSDGNGEKQNDNDERDEDDDNEEDDKRKMTTDQSCET